MNDDERIVDDLKAEAKAWSTIFWLALAFLVAVAIGAALL